VIRQRSSVSNSITPQNGERSRSLLKIVLVLKAQG
jgi:hypothetical protein